jgi:hypothetical protein
MTSEGTVQLPLCVKMIASGASVTVPPALGAEIMVSKFAVTLLLPLMVREQELPEQSPHHSLNR